MTAVRIRRVVYVAAMAVMLGATQLPAQATMHPRTAMPAAWERFTISVVNPTDTPTVRVRVEVPDAMTILAVAPLADWTFAIVPGTDTAPQAIEWSGGQVRNRELGEFAFLGRVAGDARRKTLVFPLQLTRATGTHLDYRGPPGSSTPAARVEIVGRTQLSVRGAVALAGGAVGIAILALALALARRRGTT